MLGALNMISRVLAARFIVLIAITGGIMIAYPALDHPDWFRIGILAVYCVGVVFPAVALASLGR